METAPGSAGSENELAGDLPPTSGAGWPAEAAESPGPVSGAVPPLIAGVMAECGPAAAGRWAGLRVIWSGAGGDREGINWPRDDDICGRLDDGVSVMKEVTGV